MISSYTISKLNRTVYWQCKSALWDTWESVLSHLQQLQIECFTLYYKQHFMKLNIMLISYQPKLV